MCGKSVNKSQQCDEDWLSRLPDAILVGILSRLPLKEAARTSILSPCWEDLWKHTLRLDFGVNTALRRLTKNTERRNVERRKYINWVNKVLRSYKGSALKELSFSFDLDKPTAQKAINRWIRFAFERHVESLELDCSVDGDIGRCKGDACTFPMNYFKPHHPRSLFHSFKYLKALSFNSFLVTEQAVDVFFQSCPLLESLVIKNANEISNLNICGPFALKHLGIICCMGIFTIKVSAPNLVSLEVTHAKTLLLLENVPKLVHVNVWSFNERVHLVLALFCCLSQLEVLSLHLHLEKEFLDKYSKFKFPTLPKLKKMEINFFGKGDESMIGLTSIIRAAPFLQQLVIKIRWSRLLRTKRNVKNVLNSPHQHLKVVKFLGYYGRSSDEEMVRYLLDNCVVLETLIIDPRYQPKFAHFPVSPCEIDGELTRGEGTDVYPEKFDDLDAVQTSRRYAKEQLLKQIPQHIQLVIL